MSQAALPIAAEAPPAPWVSPRPFVKWVGGKRAIVPEILQRLGEVKGRYHEPFLGGGAVFMALSRGQPLRGAVLSDWNERLVRTWRGIQNDLQGVVQELAEYQDNHCKELFYETRDLPVDQMARDAEVAAWFIYLNRTGFNGLYRVNSKGRFNVPLGRYDNPVILDEANLRAVHRVLQGVEIHHRPFDAALDEVQEGDAVYLDPPYVPLSTSAHFTAYTADGFGVADQERLARRAMALKQRGVRVVLSNHDTPQMRELYPPPFQLDALSVLRRVNRDSSKRGGVAELLIW